MRLISAKSAKELVLAGVTAELEMRNGSLASVTLRDGEGHMVRVAMDGYQLHALVPEPPKKKSVHVLTGVVPALGTSVREEFDDEWSATERQRELERAGVLAESAVAEAQVEVEF